MPGSDGQVLVVTHASVGEVITAAGRRLEAAGETVAWTDAATFNQAESQDATTEILLIGNAAICDRARLALLPRLRAIVYIASGTESVDLAAANQRGIVVAHGHTDDNADSIAEATVLLMLASLYDLHRAEALLHGDAARPSPFARMLKGKLVGLVGYGRIARAVVSRLRAWDVGFLVTTRMPPADPPDGIEVVSLDSLVSRSDIVSLHVALNAQTQGMIGRKQLEAMKRGALLVNTSRGGLIDETALAEIAERRGLRLALDTFREEPLPMASPLRGLANTILTPHMLGHSVEAAEGLVAAAFENVNRLRRGLPPLHSRNWHTLARSHEPETAATRPEGTTPASHSSAPPS